MQPCYSLSLITNFSDPSLRVLIVFSLFHIKFLMLIHFLVLFSIITAVLRLQIHICNENVINNNVKMVVHKTWT